MGHGRFGQEHRRRIELGVDVLARTARAPCRRRAGDGVRIAALDHEPGNHAVELRAVVEALLGKVDEVLHMVRGDVGKETDVDLARAGMQFGDLGGLLGHLPFLLGNCIGGLLAITV